MKLVIVIDNICQLMCVKKFSVSIAAFDFVNEFSFFSKWSNTLYLWCLKYNGIPYTHHLFCKNRTKIYENVLENTLTFHNILLDHLARYYTYTNMTNEPYNFC